MSSQLRRDRRKRGLAGNMRLDVLQTAVKTVIDACSVQVDVQLEPDGFPSPPSALCRGETFGSSVALTSDEPFTGWTLAIAADEATTRALTRTLFAMEPDETVSMADMADAMGEIPNVAAGTFKALRDEMGEHLRLGLPIFTKGHGHLKYLPSGLNGVAQTLVGEEDLEVQVILIWREPLDEQDAEAPICEVGKIENGPTVAAEPGTILHEAREALIKTLDVQMGLAMEAVGEPEFPEAPEASYGSAIPLTSATGGWNLALVCDTDSAAVFTRILFAMEDGEEAAMEDMADALGEIVNVAAGDLRKARQAAGQDVQLGLPLFMEGSSCLEFLANGIQGLAQDLEGPDGLAAKVVLIWQEGSES